MSAIKNASALAAALLVLCSQAITQTAEAAKKPAPGKKPPTYFASVPQQFVVKLTHALPETKSSKAFRDIEERLDAKIKDVIHRDLVLIERQNKETRSMALESLRANSEVRNAEPNYIFKANRTPNDADFGKLWGMRNAGDMVSNKRGLRGVDISAERAWEISTGSKDVVVAVIDTGIDFSIPDLKPNAWVNEKEANGKAGVDDDGNGFIDDVNGYDFANDDGDPTDDNGHGSHCAGTIGGRGDDGAGVAGVNWNVSLMAVKFLDANGSGSLANAIKAIDYARLNGAKVMSNSWGGGPFIQALFDSIEETRTAGSLFIAAAGNDGQNNDAYPAYPSGYEIDNVISVAALDARGDLADFSNYGLTKVDIAAPGVDVYSTVPGGFDTYSGTSMATPHVSGVAALLLAANPALTASEVKAKLFSSARPLKSLQGQVATGGMLDAYYALTGEPIPADPNDASVWTEKSVQTVSSPHPYPDASELRFTIQVPGAKRISAHFLKFDTESGYDSVQFMNAAGENLGLWTGDKSDRFSPIADGDTLILKFTSDASVNAYGFDVDSVSFER
jgi:thermitase